MNIQKIHLVNVKSYADETLQFKEGINIIGGPNGAGKTTIIESIGYALFGKRPDYTFSEFVRRGAKDGSITIEFEIDDIIYRIERTFSIKQSVDWNIYEAESNRRLDLHGEEDIKKWLSQHLHLESDDRIDTIFENVVGIEQGQFATPFLRTDRQRKDYFEPILKLDKYRKSYEATANVSRRFNDEIREIEHKIELNKKDVEKYDEKVNELKEIKIKIQKLDVEIKKNIIDKEGVEAELKQQEDFKDKINEIQTRLNEKIINIKSCEKSEKRIEENIIESETAGKIVEKTKYGKEKFESLDKKIKELETRQSDKIKLEKQKTELEKEISNKETEIASDERNFKKKESELCEDTSKRKKEIENLSEPIKIQKRLLEDISKRKDNWETLQHYADRMAGSRDNVKAIIFEFEKEIKDIEKIKEEFCDYENLRKTALGYENLNKEYENLSHRKVRLEQDIETQSKNLKKSKGGKCPFLNEACKNIESGNLEDHFENKLKLLEDEIKKVDEKINEVKNSKNNSEEFFFNIKNEIKKNIFEIRSKLRESDNELTRLETEKKGKENRIEEMKKGLIVIEEEKKKIIEDKKLLEKEKELLEKLTAEIKTYGDIDAEIKKNKEELEKFRNDYNNYMSNLKTAEKLIKLIEEKKKILKNIEELNKEKKNLNQELEQYKDKFDEVKLKSLKKKKEEYDKLLGELDNKLKERKDDEKKLNQEIEVMNKTKAVIKKQKKDLEKIQNAKKIFNFIRNGLNKIGSDVARYYLGYISDQAGRTYRAISGENVELFWDENYNIILKDREKERIFKQLSGGEQMTAAIAVRIAILKQFSRIRIGFFDEPTTHLDEERREQLAETIGHLKELERRWFDQLFVISHDDAFETITENVVILRKEDGISVKI